MKNRLLEKLNVKEIVEKIYQLLFTLATFLPVQKNLVIFESYLGKQYSCNPRAIYEYLKENHPEYKLVWSVKKSHNSLFKEKNIPFTNRLSLKWIYYMARAEFWVNNSRLPKWVRKPKHTKFLQTWHGTPLKKLALDMDEVYMPGQTTKKYKEEFIKETSRWDYLISPNPYSTEIFKRAFHFHQTIVETGYPRNDILYSKDKETIIQNFKQVHQLPSHKKVILYAPTWRDDSYYKQGRYKFDLELDIKRLQERLGKDYVMIFRLHYLVAEQLDLSAFQGFAYDFSHHEDINELYLISDVLITDYSSVFFDYANLKRPMIFFVYDIEKYRDKLRGFYFDFEKEAPGPLVKSTDEVIEELERLENDSFKLPPSFERFYQTFCGLESGESTKRVVQKVFLKH